MMVARKLKGMKVEKDESQGEGKNVERDLFHCNHCFENSIQKKWPTLKGPKAHANMRSFDGKISFIVSAKPSSSSHEFLKPYGKGHCFCGNVIRS